ncbi:AAA family ATPase [Sphingomonas yantingensis]|uniref:Uncharacterized protein n=1 Tax=Sphingomonas yantingensis TaxID=1241761 RepID=A0A7W9AQI8_9SPHN|nr:AAA family ATPase [Sphingomonas yantingensis]MBB5698509.1 hypothetical protein [Sphingomonas yantingensis]
MSNTPRLKAPTKAVNPSIARFSLRGKAAELEARAIAEVPLLGGFSLKGQVTVLAAPPNAGKTLITLASLIKAVEDGHVDPERVIYVNSDDTTSGVATKVQLLDEYGAHMVAEGYFGFRSQMLSDVLEEMIAGGSAHGAVLILDTLKKFTQVMDKAATVRFTQVMRRFTAAGGSIICLAHTNKAPNASGQNVFAGVADIRDDVDAMYVFQPKPDMDGKRIVELENVKRRGNLPDRLLYAYTADPAMSYVERLSGVHITDAYAGGDDEGLDPLTPDEEVLQTLCLFIQHGPDRGKMELVKLAAEQAKVSKMRVARLLEAYTGDDPSQHRWKRVVRAHGKFAYVPLQDCCELALAA